MKPAPQIEFAAPGRTDYLPLDSAFVGFTYSCGCRVAALRPAGD